MFVASCDKTISHGYKNEAIGATFYHSNFVSRIDRAFSKEFWKNLNRKKSKWKVLSLWPFCLSSQSFSFKKTTVSSILYEILPVHASNRVSVLFTAFLFPLKKCPVGRVARCVTCVETCANLKNKSDNCNEARECEFKCVCPWRLVENSKGRCVLRISKDCQEEANQSTTESSSSTSTTESSSSSTTESTTTGSTTGSSSSTTTQSSTTDSTTTGSTTTESTTTTTPSP